LVLAVRAIAREATLDQVPLDESDHLGEEHALLRDHIVAYRIDGPLFFAAAHRFLLELTDVTDVEVVILRMSRITALDTTGALVLKDAVRKLEHRHITVLLSGLRPDHLHRLATIGALPARGTEAVFPDTGAAIAYSRQFIPTTR
jgi:SulP family sulfate permease